MSAEREEYIDDLAFDQEEAGVVEASDDGDDDN